MKPKGLLSVAALDFHLAARFDSFEFLLERFIDLPGLGILRSGPVAAQLAGTAVVSGVGRPREVTARLFVFVFFQRKTGQIVKRNLRAGSAVVFDIASQLFHVIKV